MGEQTKTPINVNGKEIMIEDMNETQREMLNHVRDLDRKIANAKFNLDQLTVGRDSFVNMLASSIPVDDAVEAE